MSSNYVLRCVFYLDPWQESRILDVILTLLAENKQAADSRSRAASNMFAAPWVILNSCVPQSYRKRRKHHLSFTGLVDNLRNSTRNILDISRPC
jgi:hypothetical protein